MQQLDHAVEDLVREINENPVAFENLNADAQRRAFAQIRAQLHPSAVPTFEGTFRDDFAVTEGLSIPVRRYQPDDFVEAGSVVVYLHGGGWVLGNLDSADRFARALATGMSTRVVSVDYRLATVEPFPAAFTDALAVVSSEREEGATWVGLAGDSAGGNLAAAVGLACVRRAEPIDAQLLIYPCLDASCSQPSYETLADGYLLTAATMRYYWDTYAGDSDRAHERLSPASAASLKGSPPTVIATAGFDPLVDEGADYARRLIAAGVRTTYLPFNDLVHGFLDLTDRAHSARRARDTLIDAFAEIHHAQLAVR